MNLPVRDPAALEALLAELRAGGWRNGLRFWPLERAALRIGVSDCAPSAATPRVPPWAKEQWRYSRYLLARDWRRQLNKLAGLPEES